LHTYLKKIKSKDKVDKKVCVVGLGYIGLPTAALLANRGYKVLGIDIDPNVVEITNRGKIHIVENGLETFVNSAVTSGNLKASLTPEESDIFMICVPTPFYHDDSEVPRPNIEYVLSATKAISPFLKKNNIVILESTSPVGTTEKVTECISVERPDLINDKGKLDISIAYCPERVLPGRIMIELVENDRIVGGIDDESTEAVSKFYSTFVEGKVLKTNSRTAEMSKLVENSFRDVNIAFANELSIICSETDVDVWELIGLVNHHPRVNVLYPGCGVGGHCIAVDPWFLVSAYGEKAKMIRAAREINNYKKDWVIDLVNLEISRFKESNDKSPTVAFMGLAFKPNIDDLRESPALDIAKHFDNSYEGPLMFVEPNIDKGAEIFGSVTNHILVDMDVAIRDSDIFVFLVKHNEFVNETSNLPKEKKVLDFVNVADKKC